MSCPNTKAIETLYAGIMLFDNEEDVSKFCQLVCALSIGMMAGIEGQEFKRDFLTAAITDQRTVKIKKATIQ